MTLFWYSFSFLRLVWLDPNAKTAIYKFNTWSYYFHYEVTIRYKIFLTLRFQLSYSLQDPNQFYANGGIACSLCQAIGWKYSNSRPEWKNVCALKTIMLTIKAKHHTHPLVWLLTIFFIIIFNKTLFCIVYESIIHDTHVVRCILCDHELSVKLNFLVVNFLHQHVGKFSPWLPISYITHNAMWLPADSGTVVQKAMQHRFIP